MVNYVDYGKSRASTKGPTTTGLILVSGPHVSAISQRVEFLP